MAVELKFVMLFIAFLLQTARNPNVKLDTMAEMKPYQLKESSAADAIATPAMIGTRESKTGAGVLCPRRSWERMTLKAGSKVLTV